MNASEEAVAGVLKRYQDALNASDTAAVMQLYAPDSVFMAQNSPSSEGIEAIRAAYDHIFQAITLSVEFNIAEVHQVSEDWAFARTNSSGHVKVHETGDSSAEGNQELFVFQKIDNAWKIARYCFSTTNPAQA